MNRLTVAVTTVQVPHVFKQFLNMAACLAICDHALTRQCHYYLTEFATAYVVVAVKGKKIENHIITDFVTGSTVHVYRRLEQKFSGTYKELWRTIQIVYLFFLLLASFRRIDWKVVGPISPSLQLVCKTSLFQCPTLLLYCNFVARSSRTARTAMQVRYS